MRFVFNCYRHWATLVISTGDRMVHFLFSKEGVTQEDPLAMVAYLLVILPLIRELRQSHPGVTPPCCTDDAGEGGTFKGIRQHLDKLMVIGAPQGYFLETTKRILVMSTRNVLQVKAFLWGYGLQIVTGSRYLGGFVGTNAAQDFWLGKKVDGWQASVDTLAGVACQHLQTAYMGLQKSLYKE